MYFRGAERKGRDPVEAFGDLAMSQQRWTCFGKCVLGDREKLRGKKREEEEGRKREMLICIEQHLKFWTGSICFQGSFAPSDKRGV